MTSQSKNILVISDDENNTMVKRLNRHHFLPLVRRSFISAMEMIRHHHFKAIVIDKPGQNFDAIEFILNIRDVDKSTPIYIPEHYSSNEDWDLLQSCGDRIHPFTSIERLTRMLE